MTARRALVPDAPADVEVPDWDEASIQQGARAPVAQAQLGRGRIIDERYRIVDALAEGGMGWVFVAEHLALGKLVALKTIHPTFLGNEEVAARFAREAMASAQLEHPHVASAIDYGRLPDGGAYLVLELVRGPSLRKQIEQGAASWKQVCQIGAQIADALAAAHAMGIVHRDLKPDNVLLEARHQGPPIVKVLDFGIARVKAGEQDGSGTAATVALTRVGVVMGTPGYMAPEQAVGEIVDERADLYALGVILWEMLQGRPLFEASDVMALVAQQYSLERPSSALVDEPQSRIPEGLRQLIDGLLQAQPGDRLASATDVRDRLRGLAEGSHSGEAERYRVAMPALFDVPPRLRTVLVTVLEKTPPRFRELLESARHWRELAPRLRALPIAHKVVAAIAALVVVAASALAMATLVGPRESVVAVPAARVVAPVAVDAVAPSAKPAVGPAPLDQAVQARLDTLSRSRDRKEREETARWLKAPPANTEVPGFARALAKLELGPDCRARAGALRELRQLKDSRALPAIVLWNAKPQRGCGLFENRDCFECIRGDLRATRRVLQGEGGSRSASQ
jgi:serine/threonine protein kinase